MNTITIGLIILFILILPLIAVKMCTIRSKKIFQKQKIEKELMELKCNLERKPPPVEYFLETVME